VNDIETTLDERGRTHGDFYRNAALSQALKCDIADSCETVLPADVAEALDMICLKISRIVTGNHNAIDHWRDIEGYAALVRNKLEVK
jgi:pyridoxal biosynthesis lyase PdxS